MNHHKGVTLVELIVILSILLILMVVTVPSISAILQKNKMNAAVNNLLRLNNMARQYAIRQQVIVTVCPSIDGQKCTRKWTLGQLAFVDINANRKLDGLDRVVHFNSTSSPEISITWRSFRSRNFLQYSARGWTNYYNGTFRFCFSGSDLSYNRAIIINRPGRTKKSVDGNKDGVHEDSAGKEIRCDV